MNQKNIKNKKKLKIMNWNKGNSLAVNRINTIELILDTHSPDLLCIHKLNIKDTDDIGQFQIKGYYLYTDSMMEEHGMARTGMEEIKTIRRKDL